MKRFIEGEARSQAVLFPEYDLIEGTGGLRKLRFADARRGKGKLKVRKIDEKEA